MRKQWIPGTVFSPPPPPPAPGFEAIVTCEKASLVARQVAKQQFTECTSSSQCTNLSALTKFEVVLCSQLEG